MNKVIITSDVLHFRMTDEKDLDFVLYTEQHKDNKDFIVSWSIEQHKYSLNENDQLHLIIQTTDTRPIGFAILAGIDNLNNSIELIRIVIAEKNQGFGKSSIKMIQEYVFETLQAHRLWLDVMEANTRARHVYEKAGFKLEGTLRDCIKKGDKYESLIIMSILKDEYKR